MLLSDRDIQKGVDNEYIIIDPFNASNLQPASYDVHLDDILLVPTPKPNLTRWQRFIGLKAPWQPTHCDPLTDKQQLKRVTLPSRNQEPFYLPPGGVALGATSELLTILPDTRIAADIAGCSSLGRWWLFVHVTAGFIDPGWSGRLTLELYNASPWHLRLWSGMRIAQIRFWEMSSCAERNYLNIGHYAGAVTVQPADYHG